MLRSQKYMFSLIGVEPEGSIMKRKASLLDFENVILERIFTPVSTNI